MTFLATWGAPGPQVFHGRAAPTPSVVTQPGPVDGRIADTAFRRKKKRRTAVIEAPAQPVDPIRVGAVGAIPTPPPDFRTLATLSGKSVEAFRAEIDQEIAQLLVAQQERDDEEALTMILTLLED
jgi:hypothetical protein